MTIKLPKNIGILLLAVWLVLAGVLGLFHITFPGREILLQLLAIAAGIFLFLGYR
jgi:hypothetical protein